MRLLFYQVILSYEQVHPSKNLYPCAGENFRNGALPRIFSHLTVTLQFNRELQIPVLQLIKDKKECHNSPNKQQKHHKETLHYSTKIGKSCPEYLIFLE